MMPPMLEAIIFDFDGVICDTEPLHHRAFVRALANVPIPLAEDEYYARYAGLNDRAVLRAVARDQGLDLAEQNLESLLHAKNENYFTMIADGIDRLPGVDRLVPRLARRWPLAICSGARRLEIETILQHAGLLEYFRVIVSGDEVQASKPDPAGYMVTLKRLRRLIPDVLARQCLVIEDTAHGIAAARAAGMKALGIQSRLSPRQLAAADATVPTLRSVSVQSLAAMFENGETSESGFSGSRRQSSEADALPLTGPDD